MCPMQTLLSTVKLILKCLVNFIILLFIVKYAVRFTSILFLNILFCNMQMLGFHVSS